MSAKNKKESTAWLELGYTSRGDLQDHTTMHPRYIPCYFNILAAMKEGYYLCECGAIQNTKICFRCQNPSMQFIEPVL